MDKYFLVRPQGERKRHFTVTITADSNDGDILTRKRDYNEHQFDKVINHLINLKKNYSGHYELENYNNHERLPIPRTDLDERCHTLETLDIKYADDNGIIWDVELNLEYDIDWEDL